MADVREIIFEALRRRYQWASIDVTGEILAALAEKGYAVVPVAERDRLREALRASVEYMTFHSRPGVEPVPLERARAALEEASDG